MAISASATDSGRRKFTREEDDRLRLLIMQFGEHDWGAVSRHMSCRNARQCRHRYNNYLIEAHQQHAWTQAVEQLIIAKYNEIGPKWVRIATFLSGRIGNDVKNRLHKHIIRRQVTVAPETPMRRDAPPELPIRWGELFLARSQRADQPKLVTSSYLQAVLN
jgi:hypothetical protein